MQLLNVDEVAKFLTVSVRTIHRLKDAGRMPMPLRIGGCLRWELSVLEAWVADGAPNLRQLNLSGARGRRIR